MKKNYLFVLFFLASLVTMAQLDTKVSLNGNTKMQSLTKPNTIASRIAHPSQGNQIATAFWTDDFSNPATWTYSHPSGVDNWSIGTTGPSGPVAIDPINSTTAANGFAIFDSDLLCQATTHNQIADLTTASPINCSASTNVRLSFEQYYVRFYDSTFVFVSNNGTSWTKYVVNRNLVNNQAVASNSALVQLNISAVAGGQATVWIRFEFYSPSSLGTLAGCAYAWMIDDVALEDIPSNDVGMLDNSYPGPYSVIPLSQAHPMNFPGFVFNNGASATTTATMSVDVYQDVITNPVFNGVSNALSIAPGDTMAATTNTSYTPVDSGFYIVRYVTQLTGDANGTNDTLFRFFVIDDSSYARDYTAIDGADYNTALGSGADSIYLATKFDVYAQKNITSIDVFIDPSVDAVGSHYRTSVFSVNTTTGKPGVKLATSADYILQATDVGGNFLNFPMLTTATIPAGSSFFAVSNQTDSNFVGLGFANHIYEAATTFYRVGTGGTAGWQDVSVAGFIGAFIVRPNLTDLTVGIPVISGISHFAIFPNPANGKVYYNVSLEKTDDILIEVSDLTGRSVYSESISGVSKLSRSMDLNFLSPGIYNMTVRTSKGSTSEKLVIAGKQ